MQSTSQNKAMPDILLCLANLSDDNVFTPPDVANRMLDLLPQKLFRNPYAKFLDPACKSGVFLREIVKRLIHGLEDKIPGLRERVNHIMRHQVFGIATTQLMGKTTRRTVYCSMNVQSPYSHCHFPPHEKFSPDEGRIRFRESEHVCGRNGRCVFCGAKQKEAPAYEFIHTDSPEAILGMKFDVIISNPPYQIATARKTSAQATPIYQEFVRQAIKLDPEYVVMIIPARWMNGGFGLDSFRQEMLNDRHIRVLHDYHNASECFAGVDIAGGACYFLWDKNYEGDCEIISHMGENVSVMIRPMIQPGDSTFIRYNEAIPILQKVKAFGEKSFADIVSPRDPFGLNYYEDGRETMFKLFDKHNAPDKVRIYYNGWRECSPDYAERRYVTTNTEAISKYKVYISKANGAASLKIPYAVLSRPFIGEPETICNMTYLMIGPFDDKATAQNVISYISTKFFRFLVSILKNTQDAYKKVYSLVPMQDFTRSWTDSDLHEKYSLTESEIAFIDSMIRPMPLKESPRP